MHETWFGIVDIFRIPPPTPASGGQCRAFAGDMGIYSERCFFS